MLILIDKLRSGADFGQELRCCQLVWPGGILRNKGDFFRSFFS